MPKFRKIVLSNVTTKTEKIIDSPEVIESKKKLDEEKTRLHKERNKHRLIRKLNNLGYNNQTDYRNDLARKKGFNNFNEYQNFKNHENGLYLPMDTNKNCAAYLGICISEK